jgi:hypothetical protein
VTQSCWTRKTLVVRGASLLMKQFDIIEVGHEFWLEPMVVDGVPVLYTVRFESRKMYAHWENVRLAPAGSTTYPLVPLPLPKMEDPPQQEYDERCTEIDEALKEDTTGAYLRLEGVVTIVGLPHVVRFFIFDGAQEDGRDWYLIQVRTTEAENAARGEQPRQNGTAHGDPK